MNAHCGISSERTHRIETIAIAMIREIKSTRHGSIDLGAQSALFKSLQQSPDDIFGTSNWFFIDIEIRAIKKAMTGAEMLLMTIIKKINQNLGPEKKPPEPKMHNPSVSCLRTATIAFCAAALRPFCSSTTQLPFWSNCGLPRSSRLSSSSAQTDFFFLNVHALNATDVQLRMYMYMLFLWSLVRPPSDYDKRIIIVRDVI